MQNNPLKVSMHYVNEFPKEVENLWRHLDGSEEIANYSGPWFSHQDFNYSFFGRNWPVDSMLREYIKTLSEPNILYVGIGKDDNKEAVCASGPFELAAICESQGKEGYRMTLLDVQKENLEAARNRQLIFKDTKIFPELWENYLHDTNQQPPASNHDATLNYAGIPLSFESKKRNGDISFVEGDIVNVNLAPYGPFDLVHCTNILCYLRNDGALASAVQNMEKNLKDGGLVVTDEKTKNLKWNPKTREIIAKLDIPLSVIAELKLDDSSYRLLLMKKSILSDSQNY